MFSPTKSHLEFDISSQCFMASTSVTISSLPTVGIHAIQFVCRARRVWRYQNPLYPCIGDTTGHTLPGVQVFSLSTL